MDLRDGAVLVSLQTFLKPREAKSREMLGMDAGTVVGTIGDLCLVVEIEGMQALGGRRGDEGGRQPKKRRGGRTGMCGWSYHYSRQCAVNQHRRCEIKVHTVFNECSKKPNRFVIIALYISSWI